MSDELAIDVRGMTKRFGDRTVVNDIALQVRTGDEALVAAADHAETRRRVEAERAAVAAVGGGCLAPVAAYHDGVTLTALIAAEDGSWLERLTGDDPVELGLALVALAR